MPIEASEGGQGASGDGPLPRPGTSGRPAGRPAMEWQAVRFRTHQGLLRADHPADQKRTNRCKHHDADPEECPPDPSVGPLALHPHPPEDVAAVLAYQGLIPAGKEGSPPAKRKGPAPIPPFELDLDALRVSSAARAPVLTCQRRIRRSRRIGWRVHLLRVSVKPMGHPRGSEKPGFKAGRCPPLVLQATSGI